MKYIIDIPDKYVVWVGSPLEPVLGFSIEVAAHTYIIPSDIKLIPMDENKNSFDEILVEETLKRR